MAVTEFVAGRIYENALHWRFAVIKVSAGYVHYEVTGGGYEMWAGKCDVKEFSQRIVKEVPKTSNR